MTKPERHLVHAVIATNHPIPAYGGTELTDELLEVLAERVRRNELPMTKKHPDCLEYLAVHEMTHLLERGHGERFAKLMDKTMPDWRARRDRLNRHELWVRS
jgi:hypothetical protein